MSQQTRVKIFVDGEFIESAATQNDSRTNPATQ